MSVDPPRANPENLLDLIRSAHDAKVVLPEFQRSFVWGRQDIEEFLTSVLEGYFVGTFLMLDTSSAAPLFPIRTVEGLDRVNVASGPADNPTVRLVLDGQQRITSVFYALYSPEIATGNTNHPCRFYLGLDAAMADDVEAAVVGISTRDRRRMAEITSLVSEHRALPFTLFRDSGAFYHWLYQVQNIWMEKTQKDQLANIYSRFEKFMVPVVSLSAQAGKENIVNIFERINRTGISLSLFDLLAARLYLKGVQLRELWKTFKRAHQGTADVIKPEFILKVIVLLEGKEPRKSNMLDILDELSVEHFRERWEDATNAMVEAHRRAEKEYGVFAARWLPYTTILVPLAGILHALLNARTATAEAYRKLDRWYWSNVFVQRYDSGVDTKSILDLREVLSWIDGGHEPDWLRQLTSNRIDLTVDEPRSAVYRGIVCMIARRGARDFISGQRADLHACDDDHFFPKKHYGREEFVDTVLNRSVISKGTNQVLKRAKHPNAFYKECLDGHGGDERRLQQTLATHFIAGSCLAAVHANDFPAFVEERRRQLEVGIEELLGKPHSADS